MHSRIIDPTRLSTPQLVIAYNAVAEHNSLPGVTQFADVALAAARVRVLLRETKMTMVSSQNRHGWALVAGLMRPLEADDRTLTKRYAHPHPPGTDVGMRWAMLRSGGTVREYVEKYVEHYPDRSRNVAAARKDIAWWGRHSQNLLIVHHYGPA